VPKGPTVIAVKVTPGGIFTAVTVVRSVVVPSPIWPSSFQPQQYALPVR
jgi:hypothetical protein